MSIVSADAVEGRPGRAESQGCAKRAHEWREHAAQLYANCCHLATGVMQKELEETKETKKQGMSRSCDKLEWRGTRPRPVR